MSKKLILVVSILVLALAVLGMTAFANMAGKTVKIDQRIAGSIFGGIEVTTDPINQVTDNRTLLTLYAKGAPGNANIEVVGGGRLVDLDTEECPGSVAQVEFYDGGFVETFRDNSMLFYLLDPDPKAQNALCINPDGTSTGTFDYIITGGVGRYEGVTGSATVVVNAWSLTGQLSAEEGTIKGTINLP
jgi:hypothetical protein